MKHYVVYNKTSGQVLRSGTCQDYDMALQANAANDEGVMEATANTIIVAEVNLDPVRENLYATIDAAADTFCLRFVTAGATQMLRYIEKQKEAEGWVPGSSNPVDFPFLAAEATATGVTIDALATIVLTKAAEWRALGAAIEGTRLGAKKAVLDATNIAEMHTAAQVDWEALLP